MNKNFFKTNREKLYNALPENSIAISVCGMEKSKIGQRVKINCEMGLMRILADPGRSSRDKVGH